MECPAAWRKVGFLSLPDLQLDEIYKYLDRKTYLSLRRTCKATKAWVESHSNRNINCSMLEKWKKCHLEIFDDEDVYGRRPTISEFINSRLYSVISDIFIRSDNLTSLYKNPNFQEVIKTYGKNIRKLQLLAYNDCETDDEWNFFNSLTNLEELTLWTVRVRIEMGSQKKGNSISSTQSSVFKIPPCFFNLKVLIYNHPETYGRPVLTNHWVMNPMTYCPNLRVLGCGFLGKFHVYRDVSSFYEQTESKTLLYKNLSEYLKSPSMPTMKLNRLRLNLPDSTERYKADFLELVRTCETEKVKVVYDFGYKFNFDNEE